MVCCVNAAGTPALSGWPNVSAPLPALHQQRIRVAVIAAVELDDFVAPREPARQPDGAHARLRAGIRHADFLHARHQFANQLRHRHFQRIGNAEARAVVGGGFDGGNDFRMRVAENRRPPGADVINQFIAVHVPDVRAFGPVDKKRIAADGAERAHRRIHAAGNVFQRLGKKFFGFGRAKSLPRSEKRFLQRTLLGADDRAGDDVVPLKPAVAGFQNVLDVRRGGHDGRWCRSSPDDEFPQ